jgi:hypothetical protein
MSFRQKFANELRTAVENAIAHDDQRYGRQLATMFEKFGMVLRAHFGGSPLWATHSSTLLRRKHKVGP